MTDRIPLSASQLTQAVQRLTGWELKSGKLHIELQFEDFVQAFGFMTRVAIIAEKMNHHPEWSNVFNSVVIDLRTHELGGIGPQDVEWAENISKLHSSS